MGAGTVASDDPQLTVRKVEGQNPVRVVLDPDGRLDPGRRVFTDGAAHTLVVRRASARAVEREVRAEKVSVPATKSESFDLAINLFTSIGVYDEPADDRRLLENVLRSLRPGGALVIDLMGREIVHRDFAPRLVEESQGIVLTRDQELVAEGSRVQARWEIENAGRSEVFQVSNRLFPAPSWSKS